MASLRAYYITQAVSGHRRHHRSSPFRSQQRSQILCPVSYSNSVNLSSSTATPTAHAPDSFVQPPDNKAISHHHTTSGTVYHWYDRTVFWDLRLSWWLPLHLHEGSPLAPLIHRNEPNHNEAVLNCERSPGIASSSSKPGHSKRLPDQLFPSAMSQYPD